MSKLITFFKSLQLSRSILHIERIISLNEVEKLESICFRLSVLGVIVLDVEKLFFYTNNDNKSTNISNKK